MRNLFNLANFKNYALKAAEEVQWAVLIFLLYVGGAFVLTGDSPVSDWGEWFQVTSLAGARLAIGSLIATLRSVLQAAGRSPGP